MKRNRLGLGFSYFRSPRTTFVVRHPKAALMVLAAGRTLRHSRTARRMALGLIGVGAGLGAASVAVPVILSRRRLSRRAIDARGA